MKKIKAYYIDPENDIAEAREITDSLDTFYDMLRCDTIDIVNRSICGERYDIICDDEGLFKDKAYVSAIDDHYNPMLVGALLVVGEADDDGELTSLTDADVGLLQCYVKRVATTLHRTPYPMITHMTY